LSQQPTIDVRMAHLEGAYEQISHRLNSMEQRMERGFAAIDQRFAAADLRFTTSDQTVSQRFTAIEQKIDKQFLWVVGLILVSIVLPLAGRFLLR
jgi:hypothetical protein